VRVSHLKRRPALQNAFALITHHLSALSTHLDTHRPLLTTAHAYPLPTFPGRQHEGLLGTLLRKKLEPGVADWVADGADVANGVETTAGVLDVKGLAGLWDWASPKAAEIAAGDVAWGLDYSLEEREGEGGVEGVRTGIVRRLDAGGEEVDDDDSDDGEDDDDEDVDGEGKMDVDEESGRKVEKIQAVKVENKPMMPIENLMRYMSVGMLPRAMPMPPGVVR